MKLITLGCSLTHFVGLKEELAKLLNADLLNLSQASGSNHLQIMRFNELVVNDQIGKDDIIYWQITTPDRRHARLHMAMLPDAEQHQKIRFPTSIPHYICKSKNIFDKQMRIDLLSNSTMFTHSMNTDIAQDLQSLMACIIIAKQFTSKVIVTFGWENLMPLPYIKTFKDYLAKFDIKFIDQAYLEYAIHNNLEIDDTLHPVQSAGEQFAREVVYPEICKLIAMDSK